jgi:hypothetical protein
MSFSGMDVADQNMYKNANQILSHTDKSNLANQRFSIAAARIDMNVKKIHSMIANVPAATHELVLVEDSNKQGGHSELGGTEERGMRLRLLKSAALVPDELLAKRRPLSRSKLQAIEQKLDEAALSEQPKYKLHTTRKKFVPLSHMALMALEQKLAAAMRAEYRHRKRKEKEDEDIENAKKKALDLMMAKELRSQVNLADVEAGSSEHEENTLDDLLKNVSISVLCKPSSTSPIAGREEKATSSGISSASTGVIVSGGGVADENNEEKNGGDEDDNEDEDHDDLDNDAEQASDELRQIEEQKMLQAIAARQKRRELTTRDLLPYYNLDNVRHFIDMFMQVLRTLSLR